MTQSDTVKDSKPPQHCGRDMWAVKNSNANELPYDAPIWWCVECHFRLPRTEAGS